MVPVRSSQLYLRVVVVARCHLPLLCSRVERTVASSDVSPDVRTRLLFPLKLGHHFRRLAVKQPPVDTGQCVCFMHDSPVPAGPGPQSQPNACSVQGEVLGDAWEGTA